MVVGLTAGRSGLNGESDSYRAIAELLVGIAA